jgi:hypothetical protein
LSDQSIFLRSVSEEKDIQLNGLQRKIDSLKEEFEQCKQSN